MKLATVILLSFLPIFAFADEHVIPNGWSMGFHWKDKDYLLTFRPSIDVPDSPDWKAGTGEPPISSNDAFIRARDALQRLLPDVAAKSEVSAIMMWFELRDGKQKAYYVVEFSNPEVNKANGGGISPNDLCFVVLMDGRVISPKPVNAKAK